MATFNTKTISKIAFSPMQKDGIAKEEKAFVIMFEDGTQQLCAFGLKRLELQAKAAKEQIEKLQNIVAEFESLQPMVAALKD